MENPSNRWSDGFGALQWFVFLLASAVTFPVVIGQMFHLPMQEVAELMQRTFFVVGVTCFLQGWRGHRLPIADGPAGIWLSVFVVMGDAAIRHGQPLPEMLRVLEGGMIIAGLLLLVLGLKGVVGRILFMFTPLVTGTFLLLLALQLSGVFLKGMLGLGGEPPRADALMSLVAFFVFILVLGLSIWGRGWWKSYAVLIGIIAGWFAVWATGNSSLTAASDAWFRAPEIFVWGMPQWDLGMAVSAVLLSLIVLSSNVAAITAVEQVVQSDSGETSKRLNHGAVASGITHVLSSAFSTVGIVPLAVSAGFIRLTGQNRMKPFLIASLLFAGIALVPAAISVLASLPGPVAYAASMASFVQMVGIGFTSILRDPLDQRRLTILGVALLFGNGVMFLPSEIFQVMPSVVQYVCGNGLLVGTMLALLLEQVWAAPKAGDGKIAKLERNRKAAGRG